MKIIKPLTLGMLQKPYRFLSQDYLVICALGFFQLGKHNPRFLSENIQWPKILPLLPFARPIDEVMPKMRSEVLLSGSAYAPGGKAVCTMQVRLQVGEIDKRLKVIGDRTWSYSLLPLYQISPAQPFTQMPLVYQRAFGGSRHSGNLLGCGYTGQAVWLGSTHGAMPNIEYPHAPVKSAIKQLAPAGFGPLDMTWSPRKEKHGHFDQDWLDHHAPGLAKDVDWSVFNTAPVDQWLTQHFVGGESYTLEGLHPELPIISGQLPNFRAKAFVLAKDCPIEQMQAVPLQMDTVWFFPEQQIGVAIYRGQTKVQDIDAQDVAAVMLAYEAANESKTLAHYQQVFSLRLDKQTAGFHAFNESQLAPSRSAQEQAERAALCAQDATQHLNRQQALLDELEADFWQQCGIAPLPGHQPAQAKAPSLPSINPRDVADGDFDLSPLIAQAQALAAKAKAEGEAKLAQLPAKLADLPAAPASPAPDLQSQKNAAFELASVPAYDLLPELKPNLPAELAELMSVLDIAEQAGQEIEPAKREQIRSALLQQAANKRKGRQAAPRPTAPAQAMASEVATWLGSQVAQWQAGGACLAGRDLAGSNLSGIDFSGADLRQIMLEQCNLDGANFSGANLSGAVLTGASINGCNFSQANLSRANLSLSHGKDAVFIAANLQHAHTMQASWPHANLHGANLSHCLAFKMDLSFANLAQADCSNANFLDIKAEQSAWQAATLAQTILLKADLQHANFSQAKLHKAVLMDAQLQHSTWQGAHMQRVYGGGKTNFSHADLRFAQGNMCGWHGATFCWANFSDAQFLQSDFGSCDLSHTQLCRGLFSSSLFMNAKLCRANLEQADLFRALGRKADFSYANLRAANLVQVDLTGAKLEGACLDQVRLDPQRRVA